MDYINISIDQNEVDSHLSVPTEKLISHSCEVPVMPELYWHKITTLGFGYEKEKSDSDSDEKLLDYAASLFAACRQPFSVLCEKKSGSIVYAIGSQDKNLASRLLKSAFGTVKSEEYKPETCFATGLYARNFEVFRTSVDEMDKRDSLAHIHASKWVDAVAKVLLKFPGMVRLDFHPVEQEVCSKLISDAREVSDRITTYLESSIQVGDNISEGTKGNIIYTLVDTVADVVERSGNDKDNRSSNSSVSWKGVSAKLSDIKKEADYYIQLFSDAEKQGWTVEMTVSADLGAGEISSSEKEGREKALTVPLSSMLTKSGYTCQWSSFNEYVKKKDENKAILLSSSYVAELISFPTTSFYGFERVKNCYYNVNLPYSDKSVPFAKLMQYEEETEIELNLPKKELNRHTFICGMTGSGKTNTVHHLLSSIGDFPYLVIEPVKGEYHSLPDVKAYTMTAGSKDALYLNPFWFPKGTSLQFHIDYLKQIISSAFDLYAAMPNILEQSLILVYQHCGWDFIQNKNRFADELPESMLYPTFSDLCQEVENYINKSDFGEELKGNYRGALLSRLQSFTSGPKGMLLNTAKHLPCEELSRKKVVISLDSLADDADKAIVMGVIIAQYYEYLKHKCIGSKRKELRHIVVIEEAHHLFTGDSGASSSSAEGGSGQNSSNELVKTLNNMLAEIRAYGEGFIIVDQSPSALHPSVLKNTGIKIAHRIDYGQDIEAMQDALLLDKEDKELATLCSGQALVHFGGMRTSAKVKVPKCKTKEESEILKSEEISGSSAVSTLLEDSNLSKYVNRFVIGKIINQLLYDELDVGNCKEIYTQLCNYIKTVMMRFGYLELIDEITKEHILSEYITKLLPAEIEKIFPHQYCTCKMICMFMERFISILTESNGELSVAELRAFIDYRTKRIGPRIRDYFKYSDNYEYQMAYDLIGEKSIDLNLICNIVADLKKMKTNQENFESHAKSRFENEYFLCMPKAVEIFIVRARILFMSQDRKDLICWKV